MDKINIYGDEFVPTLQGYGNDVSSSRIDDLDRNCLDYAAKLVVKHKETGKIVRALDLGGGLGGQSKRLALLGADVTFVDLGNRRDAIDNFNKSHKGPPITFIQQNMRDYEGCPFDIIYSQRAIQYLRFDEAKTMLSRLFSLSPEAHVFISAVGLNADDGIDYPDRDKPIHKRFSLLRKDLAEKLQATEPMALYSKEDLSRLLEETGVRDISVWLSASGNVKATGKLPADVNPKPSRSSNNEDSSLFSLNCIR